MSSAAALLFPFALVTASQRGADTVTAADLLKELPAVTVFEMMTTPTDTVPGLFQRRTATGPRLAAIFPEAPTALMWLIEGATSYDRRALMQEFSVSDSVAMRQALYERLERDRSFTEALLALVSPLLATRGTVVIGAPRWDRVALTEREAIAFAARYFHVLVRGSETTLTLCAKPEQLDRGERRRHDPVEAWFYSAIRSAAQAGGPAMHAAGRIHRALVAELGDGITRERIEPLLWERLAEAPELAELVQREYARTAAWAPLVITR